MEKSLANGMVPADIFSDPEVFQAELDRIFTRSWVFLGFESEIPNSGDYVLRRIGRDSVIVTRDNKAQIHVLANFCPHRGPMLCQSDQGNASRFRCPYHGWVFKNNGDWIGAPEKSKAYGNIDASEWGMLKAPHVDTICGMIFACLDPDAQPLLDYLGGAAWMIRSVMGLHSDGMKVMGPPDRFRVRGDWKNGAENFSGDGYHVGVAHSAVEYIGAASRFDEVNKYTLQWVFPNGHSFLGHDLDAMFGEPAHFSLSSPEISEQFDFLGLDELQIDIARRTPPLVGTIFPNLSLSRFAGPSKPGEPPVAYTMWRQWQPYAPGEMDLWNWSLKWDFMNDKQASDAYAAGQFAFGSAGVIEQDDTAVWEGAPIAGESTWARKVGAHFNFQMGMEHLGGETQKPVTEWKGPGELFRPGPGEAPQRSFYRKWLNEMQHGC